MVHSTGLNASAIRYYEAKGIVPRPLRTDDGYRTYDPDHVDLLRFVSRLRTLRLHLDDIRRVVLLRTGGVAPCGALREALTREELSIEHEIEKLRRIRDELIHLRIEADRIEDDWPDRCVCTVVDPVRSGPSIRALVEVKLQYFEGCPNWEITSRRLSRLGVAVKYQRIETIEEAVEHGFRGSPTVLVNGVDPFHDPETSVGLACRVYRNRDGTSGSPTAEQLQDVIASAR